MLIWIIYALFHTQLNKRIINDALCIYMHWIKTCDCIHLDCVSGNEMIILLSRVTEVCDVIGTVKKKSKHVPRNDALALVA